MPKRKEQRAWNNLKAQPQRNYALCMRALGQKIEKHHVIPKSRGGKETVPLHPICHRKIHARFTMRELERFGSLDLVLANEEMIHFVAWLRHKPLDFYKANR